MGVTPKAQLGVPAAVGAPQVILPTAGMALWRRWGTMTVATPGDGHTCSR